MLTLTLSGNELWDETTESFIQVKPTTLTLEHSLIALSKWEFKWEKPFLDPETKITYTEQLDYFRCMTITPKVDPIVYLAMSVNDVNVIDNYIQKKATATWFSKRKNNKKPIKPVIWTSELIYYQMIQCGIPFECEKWHLNRLLTLIRICQEKSNPEKVSKKDAMAYNKALNKARRAKHARHTH